MIKVRTAHKCSLCERNTREECGRVECSNRPRQMTANIPSKSKVNFYGDGWHRKTKLDEN